LVDRSLLRDKFVINNTPGVEKKPSLMSLLSMAVGVEKKTIVIVFAVDGCRLTFFDGGVRVDCHSALCLRV
jgi:hypothetical protein